MSNKISLKTLYKLIKESFEIRWESGKEYADRNILSNASWGNHPEIIGFLNLIRPFIIQVIGNPEMDYLNKIPSNELNHTLNQLFGANTHAVIVGDNCSINHVIKAACEKQEIALFRCKAPTEKLITDLRYRLGMRFSEKLTMHGVFMEVHSLGLLIQGDSGIGKSELALELITRGHRLIADDAPEFSRVTPDIVSGRCPSLLQDLLEVRGLGVLNVREMYGDSAIKHSKYLRLIIHLFKQSDSAEAEPRLQSNTEIRNVLGTHVPEISIRVASGRNIAVMVEAAVQNHLINLRGYDANAAFIKRQKTLSSKQE